MRRFQLALTAIPFLVLALLIFGGCAQIQAQQQVDIGKLQADLQAQEAALVPQLQAGIAYATQAGDVEWVNCQQGILDLMNSPGQTLPNISNPFINIEVLHQGYGIAQGGLSGTFVQKVNMACAPWYVREKAEILAIAAKIGSLIH
jgi:hypothetical protein